MNRNFIRKNIFIISIVVVFSLMLVVIIKPYYSKQSSTENSLNSLKKENKQLKLENKKLKSDKDKSNGEVSSLQTQNEGIKKEITNYQNIFGKLEASIKNELVNTLSIFSPDYTKKGDKIAGLTVSNFYSKDNSDGSKNYKIDFNGEFVVKGMIVPNMIGGGYTIEIKNNLEKLPHTFREFEGINFTIKNNDEIRKALFDKYVNLTTFYNLEIEAVFKNYTYNYVPGTDAQNSAEFVRLIPQ